MLKNPSKSRFKRDHAIINPLTSSNNLLKTVNINQIHTTRFNLSNISLNFKHINHNLKHFQSHPPFSISPIKFLKIKITTILKTIIQINKITHQNPTATHTIIQFKPITNPTVTANHLTPPKTTVQPSIRVNNSKTIPHINHHPFLSLG